VGTGLSADGPFASLYSGPTSFQFMVTTVENFNKRQMSPVPMIPISPSQTPGVTTTLPENLQNGLLAYLPFNGSADDMSGDGHDGILHGPIPTVDRFGAEVQAYVFNGEDFIDIPLDVSESSYSVSLWFETTTAGGIYSITAGQPGLLGGDDRHIYIDAGGNILTRVWENETISTSGTAYNDGRYHQVVHVLNGTHQFIYIDGELKQTGNQGISDFNWQTDVIIGFSQDAGFFKGSVDDIRIYNRVLSSDEILGLYEYESTPGTAALPPPIQTGTLVFSEDFETGKLQNWDVISTGQVPFEVSNTDKNSGIYALKIGPSSCGASCFDYYKINLKLKQISLPQHTYTIEYHRKEPTDWGAQLKIIVNGIQIGEDRGIYDNQYKDSGWYKKSFVYSGIITSLEFEETDLTSAESVFLDDISITTN